MKRFDGSAIMWSLDGAEPKPTENGAWVRYSDSVPALIDVMGSLAAAISLLERSSKKAAPSDKMFDQMLNDYRASLKRARKVMKDC